MIYLLENYFFRILFIFIFLCFFCVAEYPLFLENYNCVAIKENEIIYKGPKYNLNAESSGDTTTLNINKGYFIRIPKENFVGKNIEVKCQ